MLAPALHRTYQLSLGQVGLALASANIGAMLTLIAWGNIADRIGERAVIGIGLIGASAGLVFAAYAASFVWLIAALTTVGLFGSSVNAASGRAVMNWFSSGERGLALGVRQAAVPIGGLAAALVLPHLDPRSALLALGAGVLCGGVVGWIVIRERRGERAAAAPVARSNPPLRDPRIWWLAGSSAVLSTPQICLVGFGVLFLHEVRGLSIVAAGALLAVVQLAGAGMRIAAGRWSDHLGSRLLPLQRISLALAVAVAAMTGLASAASYLLLPSVAIAGSLAIGWNGLAFTAVAEFAGRSRSGVALGLQQTALNLWAAGAAPLFAVVVAATSWRAGFGIVALSAIAANRLLVKVRLEEHRFSAVANELAG